MAINPAGGGGNNNDAEKIAKAAKRKAEQAELNEAKIEQANTVTKPKEVKETPAIKSEPGVVEESSGANTNPDSGQEGNAGQQHSNQHHAQQALKPIEDSKELKQTKTNRAYEDKKAPPEPKATTDQGDTEV